MAKDFLSSVVQEITVVYDGVVQLDLIWQGATPRPGQFFLLKPSRGGYFLGRPISVARWQRPIAREALILSFLIAEKGGGTRELSHLHPEESVLATGPLGNSWQDMPLPAVPGGDAAIALVGGSIGIAPLLAFAQALEMGSYDFYAGFKTLPFCLEDITPRKKIIATEGGAEGVQGLILDFFEPAGYSAVYACGPHPMLKAVSQQCEAVGVPCYISLERPMACGVGACLGCTVRTRDGNRRCCTDGPIFSSREVLFDE